MPKKATEERAKFSFWAPATLMRRAERQAERMKADTGLELDAFDVVRATLEKHLDPLEPAPAKPAAKKRARG